MQSVAKKALGMALLMSALAITAAWRSVEWSATTGAAVEVVLEGDNISAPDSVAAGMISFLVRNTHTEPLGFQVRDPQGNATVDIEEIAPDASKTDQANLTPGTYRLVALDGNGEDTQNTRELRVFAPAKGH